MKYQYYKGDFTRIETFYRVGDDGLKEQIPVPEHVRVEYFTKGCGDRYVAERNGDVCEGCTLSEDGMTLSLNVPLSRKPIGVGEMFAVVTVYVENAGFPDGVKNVAMPVSTGVMLWRGASDYDVSIGGVDIDISDTESPGERSGRTYSIVSNPQVVLHNLGYRPSVTVTDAVGNKVEVNVRHVDEKRSFYVIWEDKPGAPDLTDGGKIYVI